MAPDDGRRCPICFTELPITAPARRTYCSGACRTKAYEQRRREGPAQGAAPRTAPSPVAEVVPLPAPDPLDAALARAMNPRRLLAIVAAHAGRGEPTSWRAATWLLEAQGAGVEPAREEPIVKDVWLEVDELSAKRSGATVPELRAEYRRRRRTG